MEPHEKKLLDDLSKPDDALITMMGKLQGDLLLLGAAGKIGHGLSLMAQRALKQAGSRHKAIAVSRFSSKGSRQQFDDDGIETIACDLTDTEAVKKLPGASDVIYLVGQKFGTSAGNEAITWLLNAFVPGIVAMRWKNSRIAVYSSGNVYKFTPVTSNGPSESGVVDPIGEYAQSVLGRERVFEYFSRSQGTKITTVRLNYANEPRYGVLVDIGTKVAAGQPVDVTQGHANVVWARDCNLVTLRCLEIAASPPSILNLAGPKIAVRDIAARFGKLFGKEPTITGQEAPSALLSDGSFCWKTFGKPHTSVDEMCRIIADWIKAGHATWNKPTHFEVRDGKF